jgi:hypothetical protein
MQLAALVRPVSDSSRSEATQALVKTNRFVGAFLSVPLDEPKIECPHLGHGTKSLLLLPRFACQPDNDRAMILLSAYGEANGGCELCEFNSERGRSIWVVLQAPRVRLALAS